MEFGSLSPLWDLHFKFNLVSSCLHLKCLKLNSSCEFFPRKSKPSLPIDSSLSQLQRFIFRFSQQRSKLNWKNYLGKLNGKIVLPFPSSSMNFPPQVGLSPRERGEGQEAPFHEESQEMLQFQNIFLRFTSFLASSYFGEYGIFEQLDTC